ncbi:PREDICTED: cytochrome P450 78A9-like [Tarenaya hassleriana]|uniref:cytochrome P450 78A9-like n=1 Tax=Tarenaya hassleriana TaxID=28532 RepID=UPI00053C11C1|nr:PREDICTED: cytochrome P450 78A9-like [Tarenaya hassleriana]
MATELDYTSLIFVLFSKCSVLTQTHVAFSLLIAVAASFAVSLFYWAHPGGPAWGKYGRVRGRAMIPGPRGIPLVGSMSLMTSTIAHRRIAAAAERFEAKRLMAFSLGDTRVIVTCDPDVAKEILNSPVFADRPVKESAYSLMFNRAIGFAPHGVYWRTLRRIASNHLFSPKQIRRAETQRRVIAAQMVESLAEKQRKGLCFVRELLKTASLNNMMCSVFGKEYGLNREDGEVEELRGLVEEGYDLLGTLNWTDHLPWLSELDPQRIRSRCSSLVPKVNRFVSRIISEHREQTLDSPHDFVDVLLSLHGPDKLSDLDIIAVLWEMIFRGTDTVAVLIEWILARMVLYPVIQSTVQKELDRVVGRSRPVEESDVASLVYLTAVVKEVLRLHPPGPLLSWARLAITDTTVDGYHVPAGTTAMVNMWAIARDPHVWEDPLRFKPERFVAKEGEVEFSVLGSDLRLAPFGSGRRICPGRNLGLTTVIFWTATLLHEFEWGPSDENTVDLSEKLRLSSEMATPLSPKLRLRRSLSV